jgi:hypothetical protein
MLPHFVHGSLTTVALMIVVPAWLLSGTPPTAGASIWPHVLYGFVFLWLLVAFVMLLSEARENEVKKNALIYYVAVVGVPCALAWSWFRPTPYWFLEYACAAFAAAYLVVLPVAVAALNRMRPASADAGDPQQPPAERDST